ncbi:hypothetical protein ALP84_200109 [Pseudomonas cichorii]|uniref:Uncharacterized protein n=1 Tax=Pseudomonas cichorii TaxID=36746 RepID=A0A3M4WFZ8_PSECI|nr:hypothetical protein ALP84_200109 [Pseudomonas cichorii]
MCFGRCQLDAIQGSVAAAASVGLGWGDIAKIVLASGVVAALIGWLKDWLFKIRDRRLDAKFAAIELIAVLDLYTLQSRRNVRDYHEYAASLDPHTDYQNWPSCAHPDLDISRDALKHLDSKHASALVSIATEKALANQHLHAIHDASFDPTEVYAHEADVVGYFGYEVYLLANKLRRRYKLPPFGDRWGVSDEFPDLLHSWIETKNEVRTRSEPRPESE